MKDLKNCRILEIDKMPDHLIHEIQELAVEMGREMWDKANSHRHSVILAALSWIHSSFLTTLVDKEHLVEAVKVTQQALEMNVNRLLELEKNLDDSNADN